MPNRYTPANSEEFQAGSTEVLKNKLGLTLQIDMDQAEAIALKTAGDLYFRSFDAEHRFTAKDICWMHEQWLGKLYDWAGKYRSIDISKRGFMFAHAALIPDLMNDFERKILAKQAMNTCVTYTQAAKAIAVAHAELILIHPFREGNGRLARSLANLMAAQANLPPLNYQHMDQNKDAYIASIHSALSQDYELLTKMFIKIIEESEHR